MKSFRFLIFTFLVLIALTSCNSDSTKESNNQNSNLPSSTFPQEFANQNEPASTEFGEFEPFREMVFAYLMDSERTLNSQDKSWFIHKSQPKVLNCAMTKLKGYVLLNFESTQEFKQLQAQTNLPLVEWFEKCSDVTFR